MTEGGSSLIVPMQVARLTADGTFAAIPKRSKQLIVEIGASDRNTADQELLPRLPGAFLITCEPLVDKYARGLARDPRGRGDPWQPLGHHHARGLILPIAVGPVNGSSTTNALGFEGERQRLNVAADAGCSSLGKRERNASGLAFGEWCHRIKEQREVTVVPLAQVLSWIGRPVDLIKIDAQGLDLKVIESAGDLLHRIQRFSIEVVADECATLYEGQLHCSAVLQRVAQLGFDPIGHTACRLPPSFGFPRGAGNGFCEMDLLFVRRELSRESHAPYIELHAPGAHGCIGRYQSTRQGLLLLQEPPQLWNRQWPPPPEKVIVVGRRARSGPAPRMAFISDRWPTELNHSWAEGFWCPTHCFKLPDRFPFDEYRTKNISLHDERCPWTTNELGRKAG